MQFEMFLALLFALIAFVYASVGFGGGSSYLALLAVVGIGYPDIRLIALCCNVIVVSGNIVLFLKRKEINWKKNLILIAASMPLAFLGATLRIKEVTFFILLGISLLLAAILLWIQSTNISTRNRTYTASNPGIDGAIGAGVGFLSGLVGIGGGIFLSPLLHLLHWDTSRKIAATASFFIFINSLAGITGQIIQFSGNFNWELTGILCLAVFVGGQAGAHFSLKFFKPHAIRRVTAILVLIAGIEILWKQIIFE
ncbi:MAG: sulfite exporter TauE/SafE family protein [Saprospiraceae bacterium]